MVNANIGAFIKKKLAMALIIALLTVLLVLAQELIHIMENPQ
jgi:hypothetical protein